MLDAARDLLLEHGAHAATIEAISSASGAPTGSIYHRFGSRDELVTRLWMRAVCCSQTAFLEAVDVGDPAASAVRAGLSIFDFCRAQPGDARLLVSFRYEDLVRAAPVEGALADELRELNRPVEAVVAELARGAVRPRHPLGARSRAAGGVRLALWRGAASPDRRSPTAGATARRPRARAAGRGSGHSKEDLYYA